MRFSGLQTDKVFRLFKNENNSFKVVYDVDKLLVSSYPDMDWDGDGIIGGCVSKWDSFAWKVSLKCFLNR